MTLRNEFVWRHQTPTTQKKNCCVNLLYTYMELIYKFLIFGWFCLHVINLETAYESNIGKEDRCSQLIINHNFPQTLASDMQWSHCTRVVDTLEAGASIDQRR